MIAWWVIAYGAALSAVLAVMFVLLLAKQRQPAVLATVALGAVIGPVAWNAILRVTHANQFFSGAPIIVFPISWQDTGSAVFALAALSVLLGFGPLHNDPGRRVAGIATLGALATLLVEVFLY